MTTEQTEQTQTNPYNPPCPGVDFRYTLDGVQKIWDHNNPSNCGSYPIHIATYFVEAQAAELVRLANAAALLPVVVEALERLESTGKAIATHTTRSLRGAKRNAAEAVLATLKQRRIEAWDFARAALAKCKEAGL